MTVRDEFEASAAITSSLDASVRDLAAGDVRDAKAVQMEARRLIAEHQQHDEARRRLA